MVKSRRAKPAADSRFQRQNRIQKILRAQATIENRRDKTRERKCAVRTSRGRLDRIFDRHITQSCERCGALPAHFDSAFGDSITASPAYDSAARYDEVNG